MSYPPDPTASVPSAAQPSSPSPGSGPLAPDHLDVVAAPGRLAETTTALREAVAAGGPSVLDLVGLDDDAAVAALLPGARRRVVDEAPAVALPSTFDELLARRSK